MSTDRLKGVLTYLAYRSLGTAIGYVPEPVVDAVAAVIGTSLAHKPGGSLDLRRRHVERVLASTSPTVAPDPELVRRWALRSYRSYARYWVEGARLPVVAPETIRGRMVLERGFEHVREAMATGDGAVLALPHVGGWEWGGAFLATEGMPMTSVAERVEPVALFDWFVEQRRAMGLHIVPLGEESGRTMLSVLRDGGLVGLLCDRDIGGNGIGVEFFGEKTTFPAGPATLALRTGARLLVAAVYNGPGHYHRAVVTPPLDTTRTAGFRADVARLTQQIAERFEELIRRSPEQWHLYQPNWPADRDG